MDIPKKPKEIIRHRESDGAIEILDATTLEVKQVEKPTTKRVAKRTKRTFRFKLNRNSEPVLVEHGQDPKDIITEYHLFQANQVLFMNIAMRVADGETIKDILIDEGIPRYVFFNWTAKNENFKELIEEAKKMRAESYHDSLYEITQKVKEGNAKSSKVKADIYKHLMAVADPDRFGARTKVVGDPNAPIAFSVNTGIVRERDVIDVESKDATSSGDGVHAEAITAEDPSSIKKI